MLHPVLIYMYSSYLEFEGSMVSGLTRSDRFMSRTGTSAPFNVFARREKMADKIGERRVYDGSSRWRPCVRLCRGPIERATSHVNLCIRSGFELIRVRYVAAV